MNEGIDECIKKIYADKLKVYISPLFTDLEYHSFRQTFRY